MGFFARMIERQKWERLKTVGHTKTPADTLQSELKTDSNNLSLWLAESSGELSNAVLALAVARNKITRLDVLILDQQEYEQKGFTTVNSQENGLSAYTDFNEFHYDLVAIDYEKLGVLSQMIIDNTDNPEICKRYGKGDIEDILYQGLLDRKFNIEELNDNLKEKVIKLIEKKRNQQ